MLVRSTGDRSDRETVQFTEKVNSLLPTLHNWLSVHIQFKMVIKNGAQGLCVMAIVDPGFAAWWILTKSTETSKVGGTSNGLILFHHEKLITGQIRVDGHHMCTDRQYIRPTVSIYFSKYGLGAVEALLDPAFLACLLDKCFGAKAFYKALLADRLNELHALDTSWSRQQSCLAWRPLVFVQLKHVA